MASRNETDMTTLGIRHEDWQLRPHGTRAAYRRHLRRGERACESCLQAERRAWPGRSDAANARRRERYRQARAMGLSRDEASRWKDAA